MGSIDSRRLPPTSPAPLLAVGGLVTLVPLLAVLPVAAQTRGTSARDARTEGPVAVHLSPDGTWSLSAKVQGTTASGEPVTLLPNGRYEVDSSPAPVTLAKVKLAMGELRTIATSCEAYAVDFNHYPSARTLDELAKLVQPAYVKVLPRIDPWGNPYLYQTWNNGQSYRVVSGGTDGVVDAASLALTAKDPARPNGSYRDDLVFADGQFRRYPDERTRP